MEKKILYEIKNLDKMVFRCIFNGSNVEDCDIKKMKIPTQTQMHIIAYLIKHQNEEVYQKDLEDVLNLRRATVSGVLHTMEKNNLIQRITDDKDTRIIKVILDGKAHQIYEKNNKKIKKIEKVIVKDISDEEITIFYKVLEKMKENLNDYATNTLENNN